MANDRIEIGQTQIEGRGYILDDPYVSRYYDLQSPSRMAYSIGCAGFKHRASDEAFRYCELGCGNGLTVIMLAAVYPNAEFVGIDLNPEHIGNARQLATAAGVKNVSFLRGDFVEATAADFAPFDYITVHGVYSWVDGHTKDTMFEFIRQRLQPDGIAYISYNAFPGWSAKEPIWRLLNRYSKRVKGDSIAKISEGLRFLDFLSNSNAPYFEENPSARDHLQFLKSEDLHYTSHEFCNDNFAPVYCSEIFQHAGGFGLNFIAQAETCYNLDFERVPPQFREFLSSLSDALEQEVWASLLRNDFFRTDLFSKTLPERISLEDSDLWAKALVPIAPLADLPRNVSCGSRELATDDPVVGALIAAVSEGPRSLAELCLHPNLCRFSPRVIIETAQSLELSGYFAFLLRMPTSHAQQPQGSWRFANSAIGVLLRERLMENQCGYLAAPNLGTAIRLDQASALALLALDSRSLEEAGIEFARSLNEDAPELFRFAVSADWAITYLEDFERRWRQILFTVGSVV